MSNYYHKNRGMFLETVLNRTIVFYQNNGVGIFHKKATPTTIQKIRHYQDGRIVVEKGLIAKKSTADYYGVYRGMFVAFEAKSTQLKALPLASIKMHQLKYLQQINEHQGKAFFLIYFVYYDQYFLIYPQKFVHLKQKSITKEFATTHGQELFLTYPGILDFINLI